MSNPYLNGKEAGATMSRAEAAAYAEKCKSPDFDTRYYARGVVMAAAQRIDRHVSGVSAAIALLATPAPLEGDELVLALSRAVDAVRDGIKAPVWTPLEAVLPHEWCGGFMFMAAREGRVVMGSPDRRTRKTFFEYKHGITRRYLIIGDDLQAYVYRADVCEIDDPAYAWTPMESAIERAFEGVEELGGTRTTKYDADFIAARNARLAAAGYTVIC